MIKINCTYCINASECSNQNVKRSFFGFGNRLCVEYYDQRKKCECKKEYSKPIPPPSPIVPTMPPSRSIKEWKGTPEPEPTPEYITPHISLRAKGLLKYITESCYNHKISVEFSTNSVVYADDGIPCSGYFSGNHNSPENNKLALATGKPEIEWIPIALHEHNHMLQYVHKSEYWMNLYLPDGRLADEEFFSWLSDEKYEVSDIADVTARVLAVELDCERRTAECIGWMGFDDIINVEEYIQRSNAYIYFYLYVLKTRKWCAPRMSPYMIEDIWKAAPKSFNNDYSVIPSELYEQFEKCYGE